MSTVKVTGMRAVSVPVDDQDAALRFYRDVLGFVLVRDAPTPNGRWIELTPGGDTAITLELATEATRRARGAIGIRFTADDAEVAHQALSASGVDVDDILHWPGVPPMFGFRDLDGNAFSISEPG